MKKTFKVTGLVALVMTMVFAFSAFTPVNDNDKTCTVTVKYSNGDLADDVEVTAFYKGIISSYQDYKTNDKGVVILKWADEIDYLYVKGDKYEVNYSEGKSYTLTLKKRNKYD